MRLLPQDLGTKWHILTVRNRALGVASVWTKPVAPRLGTLGKRWIKDLPVSEEVAATTLPLTADKTNHVAWVFGAGLGWVFPAAALGMLGDFFSGGGGAAQFLLGEAITLGLGGAYGYATFIGLPRLHLKKLHATPVTEDELTPFLTGNVPGLPQVFGQMAGQLLRLLQQSPASAERDPLEAAFLSLVRDVVRNETVPENQQDELRAAVCAIGEALCRLPPISEMENTGSSILAANQRAEAQMLHARAERETDSVVAGSLHRQAAALQNAARASENGVVVARRVRALRQELRAQMEVLRLTLPTWGRPAQTASVQAHSAHTEATLGNIAEAVQSVAREAVAMTDAHDELDSFLKSGESRWNGSSSTDDVQTLRAR